MAHVILEGPAGQLEARLDGQGDGAAVLCHPHPLYGGSMDDLVVEALGDALNRTGYSALRFNFRGVGHSAGTHDQGRGEVDDVCTAAGWLEDRGYVPVLLAGYSFGAVMAVMAAERIRPAGLLLIAPPVSMLGNAGPPGVPTCVVLGDDDQFVDAGETKAWFGDQADITVIPDADHFFHGYHDRITGTVADFLSRTGLDR